jgi:MoxR-like ATPase
MTVLPRNDESFAPPTGRRLADGFAALSANIATVIRGKPEAIELAATCLLAEGHLLIEDVPGVGKTSLAKALATSIASPWRRIQFTPDLLPTDVVGVSIWNKDTETFEFQPGPVFANVVLADEINRASPKTQSALLEAMEERQVSVDGRTWTLPSPFMVIATQNPVEHEGTYRLPESQLDRFLMRISLGYPAREAELAMLDTHGTGSAMARLSAALSPIEVRSMIETVKAVHLAPGLKHYLVDIAEASRHHRAVALGLSPRSTLQFARAIRARAATHGRDYAIPDDVKALGSAVLAHRVLLRRDAALAKVSTEQVIAEVLASVSVPPAR